MRTKLLWALFALIVILGCGGAGAPYVPNGGGTTTSGNFSILGSGTQTVPQGQTARFNLQVFLGQQQYLVDRSPAPVALSVSGLPNNSTASFSSNPVVPTDPATDVTLDVVTQATTTPGTYTLTVTGDDGDLQETTTFTLIVSSNAFTLGVETLDGQFDNQEIINNRTLDASSANYRLSVAAPPGYVGQVRVEYRFTQVGAPSAADVHSVWHYGQNADTAPTFTYTVGASNENDSMECTLHRSRQPIPVGDFEIEFKIVPLVNGFAPVTQTASLRIVDPTQSGKGIKR
jgi:hypothetical protein